MVQFFSHWFRWSAVLRAALETAFLVLSVVLALFVLSPHALAEIGAAIPALALFSVIVLMINSALGVYHTSAAQSIRVRLSKVFLSLLLAVPVAYLVFEQLTRFWSHGELLEIAAVIAIISHTIIRGYSASARNPASVFSNRILIIGTGAEAAAVRDSIHRYGHDFEIVGFFPSGLTETTCVSRSAIFKSNGELFEVARRLRVSQIVVAVGDRRGGAVPLRQLLDCKLSGIKVLDLSSYFERVLGQVRLDTLRASWLIYGEGFRQGVSRTTVKRLFDIVASSALLILASPVMLVTACLIVLESGFPILYRQERVGQGGRPFNVVKFRSMVSDAERDGKPRWASSNDSRVTRIGRIIRKLRIDELPQLFNVLKGEMSLVGPRPERPFFVGQLGENIPFYAARHSVKPGVTGWAQVRYPYGASVEDSVQKLQYDLYYVKNHSLFLDLLIVLETIEVVLTGRGAQ